jgi:hypothetical protein
MIVVFNVFCAIEGILNEDKMMLGGFMKMTFAGVSNLVLLLPRKIEEDRDFSTLFSLLVLTFLGPW